MDQVMAGLLEYGLAGIVIVGLVVYIRYSLQRQDAIELRHAAERKEWLLEQGKASEQWRSTTSMQFDKLIEAQVRSTEGMERNTSMIADLRGLLSSIDKRI